ncbi:hypothetical protein P168DRAFT_286761 [Aspergillus campestris IBT 28561]|uniref:CENP-V/GFA domain-containing protein n=1 Tax=Aspergillus campestris (strain IBT 28561) TaxID=1392248 RepID=A0A2I1DFP4_ASPC2|nr:uncharacterized protein P168DRAFT_286761 [Aspergillus campestris IBT 28561]PKY08680.1 hypothetical protein P168DRAFT_286761 [Aspergillus campestris IBT 28561]
MADDAPGGGSPLPNPGVGLGSVEKYPKELAWQTRPPYRVVSRDEFGEVKWKGGCHCGRVTYEVNREQPLKAKYCHCRGCQVVHGAPFQWAAIFQKSDISFINGADGLAFYASDRKTTKYELPTKVSCAYCRTPIMDEGRNMCLLFPGTIHFGDSQEEQDAWMKAFEISCHIFYSQRSLNILDGKQKWSGMDENSDLVDDYGKKV